MREAPAPHHGDMLLICELILQRRAMISDNTRAIRFYQRWGMDPCAFYRYGVRRSRKVKPSIPERGVEGIPLEHELEFEMLLGGTLRSKVSVQEDTKRGQNVPRIRAYGTA